MKTTIALFLSLFALVSSSHAANSDESPSFSDLPWEIKRQLMHYMPLQSQFMLRLASKDFWEIFKEKGRAIKLKIDAANVDEFIEDIERFPRPSVLISLAIEEDVSNKKVEAIFNHITDFGFLLEEIDLKATINEKQLSKLCGLPRLAKVSIANSDFSDEVLKEFLSCPALKAFSSEGLATTGFARLLFQKSDWEMVKLRHLSVDNDMNDVFDGRIVFSNLHTLSLSGVGLPCNALTNVSKFAPKLKHLKLGGLQRGCTLDEAASSGIVELETIELEGQGFAIHEKQIEKITKQFPGHVYFQINQGSNHVKANKLVQENSFGDFNFNLGKMDLSWIPPLIKDAPQRRCSFNFHGDTGNANADEIKQVLESVITSKSPCDAINVGFYADSVYIGRDREDSCDSRVKFLLNADFMNLEKTPNFLPKINIPLGVAINNIDDYRDAFPLLELDGLKQLTLVSNQPQNVELDTLMTLSTHKNLRSLELRAKTLKFGQDCLKKADEQNGILVRQDTEGSSIHFEKMNPEEYRHKGPFQISLGKGIPLNSLQSILSEDLDFYFQIDDLATSFDEMGLAKLLAHPRLSGISLIQQSNEPFLITEKLVAVLNQSPLGRFFIGANSVEFEDGGVKKNFKEVWSAYHENDRNHNYNRFHEGEDKRVIKNISRSGAFKLADLPAKKPFSLHLRDTIDLDSLRGAITLLGLESLHLSPKETFVLTPEFVSAISEQEHIKYIRIEGKFSLTPGVLKNLSHFNHVSFGDDEKGGENIDFSRGGHGVQGGNEGITCSMRNWNPNSFFGIETLMGVISIPNLNELALMGNIKLDERAIQLLASVKTLSKLNLIDIADFTCLNHLSSLKNLQELQIHTREIEKLHSSVVPCLKQINVGRVLLNGFSSGKESHHNIAIICGQLINDEFLREKMHIGRDGPKHEKCSEVKQTSEFSLLNTAITGEILIDFPGWKEITKLNLSGSNDIKLEHLIEFATRAMSCTEIILPMALADAVNLLSEQFSQIKFSLEGDNQ